MRRREGKTREDELDKISKEEVSLGIDFVGEIFKRLLKSRDLSFGPTFIVSSRRPSPHL